MPLVEIPPVVKSNLERKFYTLWVERRSWLPLPEPQYRFVAHEVGGTGTGLRKRMEDQQKRAQLSAPLSDFRADFAWPDIHLAVELDGLKSVTKKGDVQGGHHSFYGWLRDIRKGNLYSFFGWNYLRFTTLDFASEQSKNDMLALICHMMKDSGWVVDPPKSSLVDTINEILQQED